MFKISGILSSKSLVKSGVSEHGAWKITQFLIQKTRKKKKVNIPFTAKGSLANKIDGIAIGERLTIRFFIEGNKHNDRYYTNCIAIDIDKYVPKKKIEHGSVAFGDEVYEDKSLDYRTDNNLFNTISEEE